MFFSGPKCVPMALPTLVIDDGLWRTKVGFSTSLEPLLIQSVGDVKIPPRQGFTIESRIRVWFALFLILANLELGKLLSLNSKNRLPASTKSCSPSSRKTLHQTEKNSKKFGLNNSTPPPFILVLILCSPWLPLAEPLAVLLILVLILVELARSLMESFILKP